jgi:hypothetical protein
MEGGSKDLPSAERHIFKMPGQMRLEQQPGLTKTFSLARLKKK